jgi:hypothetical protein
MTKKKERKNQLDILLHLSTDHDDKRKKLRADQFDTDTANLYEIWMEIPESYTNYLKEKHQKRSGKKKTLSEIKQVEYLYYFQQKDNGKMHIQNYGLLSR